MTIGNLNIFHYIIKTYIVVALCLSPFFNPHIHLIENHHGTSDHGHEFEAHIHPESHHDSIDNTLTHSSDAQFVDLNNEANIKNQSNELDQVPLFILVAFGFLFVLLSKYYIPIPHKLSYRKIYLQSYSARAPPKTS